MAETVSYTFMNDLNDNVCHFLYVCNHPVYVCINLIITFIAVNVFAGVKSVSIDVSKESVLVESALTSAEVQALIESTGRRAVLKGIGGSEQGEKTCRYYLFNQRCTRQGSSYSETVSTSLSSKTPQGSLKHYLFW